MILMAKLIACLTIASLKWLATFRPLYYRSCLEDVTIRYQITLVIIKD